MAVLNSLYGQLSLHHGNEAPLPPGFVWKKNILKEKESKVSEGLVETSVSAIPRLFFFSRSYKKLLKIAFKYVRKVEY